MLMHVVEHELPNHSNNFLNMIWKTMQEEKIERERIRRETEEKQVTNRKDGKERLKQLITQNWEDVERMNESFVKYEDRASKLGADISSFEKKTEHRVSCVWPCNGVLRLCFSDFS
jgi:predicted nuclease with TOPRIM domain